jgi:uncharacterized protein (TIGR03000 family)
MVGCGGGCGGGVYAADLPVADYGTVAEALPVQAAPSDAILVVHLPEDARLTVDDEATTSTSDVRMFRTPELKDGKVYHYTLRAAITRAGKTQTVTRSVSIRRGEETHVTLDFATQVAAR